MNANGESGFDHTILIDNGFEDGKTLVDEKQSGADRQSKHEETHYEQKTGFKREYDPTSVQFRRHNSRNVSVACGRLGSAHCRRRHDLVFQPVEVRIQDGS